MRWNLGVYTQLPGFWWLFGWVFHKPVIVVVRTIPKNRSFPVQNEVERIVDPTISWNRSTSFLLQRTEINKKKESRCVCVLINNIADPLCSRMSAQDARRPSRAMKIYPEWPVIVQHNTTASPDTKRRGGCDNDYERCRHTRPRRLANGTTRTPP